MSVPAQTLSRSNMREFAFSMDAMNQEIADHVFSHSPSLMIFTGRDLGDFGGVKLRGRGEYTQQGGHAVLKRVRLGSHAGAKNAASGWDTHNVSPDSNVRLAEINWRFYNHAVAISEHDLEVNRGVAAISSFLEDQMESVWASLAELLAQHIHATSRGANAIESLDTLISANDSVQGLSGATYTNYNARGASDRGTAPGSVSFASGSFSAQGLPDMRKAFHNASEGTVQPDVLLTEYATVERYEGAILPQARYRGDVRSADASFSALAFKEKPMIADPDCASGRLYMVSLNPRDGIRLIALEGANFEWGDFKPSSNQTAMVRPLKVTCALAIGNRRRSNKLTGITD